MDKIDEIVDPEQADEARIASGEITYPQLFSKEQEIYDLAKSLTKEVEYKTVEKEQGKEAQPTNQQTYVVSLLNQTIPHPVSVSAARTFKDVSPHHASCIQSKKYSILGLGFVSEGTEIEDSKARSDTGVKATEDKVGSLLTGEAYIESKADKTLNPLTIQGFLPELYKVVEDFLDAGTGYLEVVRGGGDEIIGLNWLPYEDVHVAIVIDNDGRTRVVYRYTGSFMGQAQGLLRVYSLFGKANRDWVFDTFYNRTKDDTGSDEAPRDEFNNIFAAGDITKQQVSEVIPFMVPSNRSRYYGYPEWLSAAPFVTLLTAAMQYKSDFYTNRGVMAYILGVMGSIDDDKWTAIKNNMQGTVGGGNNFKNLVVQMNDPKSKIVVEKLASSDKTEMQFTADSEVFAQSIVSAHRVPPVLANILIPGKLGATNETVQAIVSFQLLEVGPKQSMVENTLASTLGGKDGIKNLDPEDFRLRKITSQFDITGLDTVGRMREEAVGANRDVSEGVKD